MRRMLLLAVILAAIQPLCAQYDKLTELRRTLTEHYSDDAEKNVHPLGISMHEN